MYEREFSISNYQFSLSFLGITFCMVHWQNNKSSPFLSGYCTPQEGYIEPFIPAASCGVFWKVLDKLALVFRPDIPLAAIPYHALPGPVFVVVNDFTNRDLMQFDFHIIYPLANVLLRSLAGDNSCCS